MMIRIDKVRVSDRQAPDVFWDVEVIGADSDRAAVRHVKRTELLIRRAHEKRGGRKRYDVRVVGGAYAHGASVLLPLEDWQAVLRALDDDQVTVARRILGQLPLDDLRWEGLIDEYEKKRATAMVRGERTVTRDEAVAWLRQREGDTVSLTVFGAEMDIDHGHFSDEWVSVKGVLRDLSEGDEWLWTIGDVRGSSAFLGLDDSRVECRILDRWASFNAREVRARLGDVPWKDPAQLDDAVERARRWAVREQLLLKLGQTRIALERDDDNHDDDDDDDDEDDAAGPPPGGIAEPKPRGDRDRRWEAGHWRLDAVSQ